MDFPRLFVGLALTPTFVPVALPAQQSCVIETFAGGGTGTPGDGGRAVQATLHTPLDGAIAPDGTIYFTDVGADALRRVDPNGTIHTILRTSDLPTVIPAGDMALGPDGSIYFGARPQVWRRFPDGRLERMAGNGGIGSPIEGSIALESSWTGSAMAVASDGSLYFVETDRHRVRRISPEGRVFTVAGSSKADDRGTVRGGFSGDGGQAINAELNQPRDVAIGHDGSVYIADAGNYRLRRIRPDGIIETLLVSTGLPYRIEIDGLQGIHVYLLSRGVFRLLPDGSTQLETDEAAGVLLSGPWGEVVYLNRSRQFVRLAPGRAKEIVAGTGKIPSPTEGPAREAYITYPFDIEFGPSGDLYVAAIDRILAVSPDGMLRIVTGNGKS